MIKAVALGLTLVVTVLLTGCGIGVTDEAPTGDIRAAAPTLLLPDEPGPSSATTNPPIGGKDTGRSGSDGGAPSRSRGRPASHS